jgi:hypothetical protein
MAESAAPVRSEIEHLEADIVRTHGRLTLDLATLERKAQVALDPAAPLPPAGGEAAVAWALRGLRLLGQADAHVRSGAALPAAGAVGFIMGLKPWTWIRKRRATISGPGPSRQRAAGLPV